jgi:peptidoglycan/xylan/chitin deacetylase (PgdA/CDA1 family)/membrane-associated phospholipid phosphatase
MGLKAFGTTVGMCAFFVGYFALLRHPSGPVAIMPRTWLDQVVPFQPWTLAPYLSLWLYLSLAPALMVDRRQLWSFAGGCLGLSLAGYAFYYFFPTALPPTDIDWTQHPFFQFLKNTDASGNACPSLHAAFAVFTALWFARILPAIGAGRITQGLNLLWALLIVYSTVATRQHVTLDALFGVALGALVASLNFIAAPCREAVTATPRPLFFAVVAIKLSALLLWTSGVPLTWSFALFLSGGALVLWALFAPNAQGVVPVFTRFHTPRPEFWLTLDDGPDPDDTPRLLALLAQHHARATFFLIGERASRHPELVAAILRAGHEVAHHTHTHPRLGLWAYSRAELAAELDRASAVFAAAGAPPPRRFRAPMGIKNLGLHRALAARGLVCIGWSLRSHDSFATDPAAVAARVLRRLRPGRIVVMHEGPFLAPSVRVEAVRQVLAGASDRGLRAIIPTGDQLG